MLVCGPIGVTLLSLLGPKLLKPDAKSGAGEADGAAGASAPAMDSLPSDAAAALEGVGASAPGVRHAGGRRPGYGAKRSSLATSSLPAILPAAVRGGRGRVDVGKAGAWVGGGGGGAGAVALPPGDVAPDADGPASDAGSEAQLDAERDDAYTDALLHDIDPELHRRGWLGVGLGLPV